MITIPVKIALKLSCPLCASSNVETNGEKDDESLSQEQMDEMDKFRCRDCRETFNKCEERWQH